jgi:hypothetical protein
MQKAYLFASIPPLLTESTLTLSFPAAYAVGTSAICKATTATPSASPVEMFLIIMSSLGEVEPGRDFRSRRSQLWNVMVLFQRVDASLRDLRMTRPFRR